VAIRAATPHDAAAIAAIYAPIVRDTAISFEVDPPDAAEMERRILESLVWLVADADGDLVGYSYAAPFHRRAAYRWSAEVSIFVAEGRQRGGIGARLLTSLVDELRNRGFVNAFAGIALPNPASVGLFESLRFEPIGIQKQVGFKLDRWWDVGWWQLHLRARTVPPPELRI
jgi:L-amino acid N-acyltransferase YncA